MKSEQLNELATALSQAQSEIKSALKDSTNPFFKSHYADLTSVWNACREALTKNGLSIVQTIEADGLKTTLLHRSGQWIDGTCPLINSKGDMQGLGSAISYSRRYSVAAICGVTTEDDDAQTAVQKPIAAIAASFAQKMQEEKKSVEDLFGLESKPVRLVSPGQAKMVYAKCKALGMTNEVMKKFLIDTVYVNQTEHIPLDKLDLVLAKLQETVTNDASSWK